MTPDALLDLIETNLQAACPNRLVTREGLDFAQRPQVDMRRGVITIIGMGLSDLKAPRAVEDIAGRLKLVLLGEIQLPEKATGLEVEKAEWALWEEIKAFTRAPGAGLCPLDALGVALSGQIKKPYGFAAVECEYAEID